MTSRVAGGGASAHLQLSLGERHGTPRTGHQSNIGQTTRQTLIPKGSSESLIFRPKCQVFGLLAEAGVPRENPCMHGENMLAPSWDSCCKATVLTTAPPCSLLLQQVVFILHLLLQPKYKHELFH
ncbi:hypothetical protein ATANTOWER_031047 [Ataeniobius toweri]|uniref:Uncharacterized protein n=1 Tax=Ataeniobius toweri TaxID=208326 RepID=A0ABU7CJ12_9TELE|nr:hypothetical protein [Ataeniobius toweri]